MNNPAFFPHVIRGICDDADPIKRSDSIDEAAEELVNSPPERVQEFWSDVERSVHEDDSNTSLSLLQTE